MRYEVKIYAEEMINIDDEEYFYFTSFLEHNGDEIEIYSDSSYAVVVAETSRILDRWFEK